MAGEFEPRSIKSRLLQFIVQQGPDSSRRNLQQWGRNVACVSDDMIDLALNGLIRDGFLIKTVDGIYKMTAKSPPQERSDRITAGKPSNSSAHIARPVVEIPLGHKVCGTCERPKPATRDYFRPANRSPDLLASDCLECHPASLPLRRGPIENVRGGGLPAPPAISDGRAVVNGPHQVTVTCNHPTSAEDPVIEPAKPTSAPLNFVREEVHGLYAHVEGKDRRLCIRRTLDDFGGPPIRASRERAIEFARWVLQVYGEL